ncbi:MAG: SDR family oxidoreductase [Alphaproteobacteria bacterium]|nr:SDR family oxidoreductase [Alphaproteobacteria bacterium]
MRDLEGRIALVAGATRGAGRGIATGLGERGATVICTGRTTREQRSELGRAETIEETAERVTAAGGTGIAIRCDHAVPAEVEALADRIRSEHGGLDLVVDDIWGGEALMEFGVPVWELDLDKARRMLDGALWTHLVNVRHLSGLLRGRERPLWIEVTDGNAFGYRGTLVYDLVKMAVIRLAFDLGQELRSEGITALAITPGFLRSEQMLDHFGVTEANWRDGIAVDANFAASETPLYVGRCVAALAADPDVHRHNGRVLASWDVARAHGIVDADGRRPHWAEHFAEAYGRPFRAADDDAYASWERDSSFAIVTE